MRMERSRTSFDHWLHKNNFTFRESRGRNITVQCNLCLPTIKLLSTAKDTTSNLKKHLERKHSLQFKKKLSKDEPSNSGHQVPEFGPSDTKQPKMDHTLYTSQSKLNALIFNFIVEDVQPISILEQAGFQRLIEVLSRGKTVMNRKTFVSRLDATFDKMKEELRAKLDRVQSLCTTADIWSVQDRSYFGITCHWLEDNFERKSVALACTRMYGGHTCETVIAKIQEIHSSYNIESKICSTVTDNGSNFVKAFREFLPEDEREVEEIQFDDLGKMLSEGDVGGDFFLSYFLPPHQQCAAQTLNLIASKDLADAISKEPIQRVHVSSTAKCALIWQKAHSSQMVADMVETIANIKFTDPCLTQWGSEYNFVQKIMSLTDEQLTQLIDILDVPNFVPEETAYLREYADVFKPVAFALDLLQGEQKCFLGIVIPTLLTLKRKLQEKAGNTQFFSEVIDGTVEAIDSRFKQVFNSTDAKLATTTMPQFRLWWLPEGERESVRERLVAEVSQLDQANEEVDTNGISVHEDEFFSYGPGSSGNRDGKRGAAEEVRIYLEGTNKDLLCLSEFPGVKKLFIKFNTTLPSSVPVERLFSSGGNILTRKRSTLTDEQFERLLLLRYNSKVCTTAFE
ncbi:zinc finger BED domain-containing protein 4 [Triplophysa dalaica]|uniref:zinc finger BED domain-containing protein 4 n=1 Tax=Triplophysa dalaica TaxID=1582913 RepID=UPI0024DF6028|nr:zinc finger BED domain-containing protein 4 [Triplophysa dalaica]